MNPGEGRTQPQQEMSKNYRKIEIEFIAEGLTLAYFSASSLISLGTSSCLPLVTEMKDNVSKAL